MTGAADASADPLEQGLRAAAVAVLSTAEPEAKATLTRRAAEAWRAARAAGRAPLSTGPETGPETGTGPGTGTGPVTPPDRPARPAEPALLEPRDVPRRRPGSAAGRLALLHAIAHIELNAVDLHWDMVARFPETEMPTGFYDDWVKAADEEAKHFQLLNACLRARGSYYGALPAHAGMWRAAEDTAKDMPARLAVVPMVLEARGLDVTPGMIAQFEAAGAEDVVAALSTIYAEEVGHVAYGSKWFHFLCGRHDWDPEARFQSLVRRFFHAPLKPPFNEEKRAEAGLPPTYYWPLVGD